MTSQLPFSSFHPPKPTVSSKSFLHHVYMDYVFQGDWIHYFKRSLKVLQGLKSILMYQFINVSCSRAWWCKWPEKVVRSNRRKSGLWVGGPGKERDVWLLPCLEAVDNFFFFLSTFRWFPRTRSSGEGEKVCLARQTRRLVTSRKILSQPWL